MKKATDKQKRKARHIEEGYEQRGVSEREAERGAQALKASMRPGEIRARLVQLVPPKP